MNIYVCVCQRHKKTSYDGTEATKNKHLMLTNVDVFFKKIFKVFMQKLKHTDVISTPPWFPSQTALNETETVSQEGSEVTSHT